ncbi:head GIN domain-containing protein [Sphingomonas abietis]|uniref:DUF2807 domain-containing protein n=1 Tax=Sphingomonas abietis TaxID=3012344 RepID=A0ABY7NNX9_9SPHN|nr:head GIN domain-containing protein [Sphingomonas abietis]WBO22530.1 DUF2807 domain-containing protein [Sphingomonas abietis]
MRPLPILLIATLSVMPMSAATAATGATRDFSAQGFDTVELNSAAQVTITAGPRFSVHADGDPRLLQRLTAEVHGNRLLIGWMSGSVEVANRHIHVTITMPRVAGAAISGAGSIAIDRVDAPAFSADVGGAGTIRIASLRAQRTTLTMGGTGEIVVAGRTARLQSSMSGVGTVDAANLAADAGQLNMSGTGRIRARVDGPADVNLSGMGNIVVTGNPQCSIHKSGLGNVRCG